MDMLGTLHQRVGDDLRGSENDARLWARVFGNDSVTLKADNVTSPEADAHNYGIQAGFDLYQSKDADGNQALSERRASTVRNYLIQSGIPANDVRATGYGESKPVTTLQQCQGQAGAALIACLQPDRRVEVEVSGTRNP
jgi:hypothetical protein